MWLYSQYSQYHKWDRVITALLLLSSKESTSITDRSIIAHIIFDIVVRDDYLLSNSSDNFILVVHNKLVELASKFVNDAGQSNPASWAPIYYNYLFGQDIKYSTNYDKDCQIKIISTPPFSPYSAEIHELFNN